MYDEDIDGTVPGADGDELAQESDDDPEYEMEEEEQDEQDEPKQIGGAYDTAYVMHNRSAFYVPLVDNASGEAGRVRDYGGVVVVDNALLLGNMRSYKNWPKVEDIPQNAIVVIKGRMKENETIPKSKAQGNFAWYARVVIKGNEDGPDREILRLIPRPVAKAIRVHSVKDEEYSHSTLITRYIPLEDNAREFPVAINGWSKVPGIKSESVQPKKEHTKPEPSAAKRKAAEDPESDDAPSPSAPLKKSKEKAVHAPPPKPAPKPEPAPEPAPKPEPVKKGVASYFQSKKVEPKGAEGGCSTGNGAANEVKCYETIVEVKNKERTHVFWTDNTMHILEY